MNRKQSIILVLFAALVLSFVGAYIGIQVGQNEQIESANGLDILDNSNVTIIESDDLIKVQQAFNIIKEFYVEEVDDDVLIEGAIHGMLSTLEDPFSEYMNAETMQRFEQQLESSFEGIGAEVSMVNGRVTIVSPIKDSPAEAASLRPNDQILKIDQEDIEGLDLNEAVEKIRGEKGTEVVLEILRPGVSEPFEVTIVRDTIPLDTVHVSTEVIDDHKTGILEITSFSEQTSTEFETYLEQLENEGIDGLVIDVRGNPGGYLHAVEEILQLFVPKDMPYMQIEDKDGEKTPFYSNLEEKKAYPITVLIDEGSASASEILAVALKEMGYDVVGLPSFGKGTVQQAVNLGSDGSNIKLTFFKWLSPEGNWINEVGVEPTVEVDQPDYYYTYPIVVDEGPLVYDTTGERVQNLQRILIGLGYDPGRDDGYFSESTQSAVESFQADHELPVTGEVDSETAGLLESKIIEKIRNGEDDQQLERALEILYE